MQVFFLYHPGNRIRQENIKLPEFSRNDLLNYKAKYADVDAQYKLIKNERTMLNKQVKSIERRIKNIDRAKDRIRKNPLEFLSYQVGSENRVVQVGKVVRYVGKEHAKRIFETNLCLEEYHEIILRH